MGCAFKLSEERALTIGTFLASQGVDQARIEVKAWGDKKISCQSLKESMIKIEFL